jgi:hypothetical protein
MPNICSIKLVTRNRYNYTFVIVLMLQKLTNTIRLGLMAWGMHSRAFSTTTKPSEQKSQTESEEMNLQLFYRNLLRNTRVRLTNGMASFDVSHMYSMIKLTRSVEDAPLLLEAYYNLHGNYTKFPNSTIDRVILKYLEVGGLPGSIVELY